MWNAIHFASVACGAIYHHPRARMPETLDEPATYSDAIATSSSSDEEGIKMRTPRTRPIISSTSTTNPALRVSMANPNVHTTFLQRAIALLLDKAVFGGANRQTPVLEWQEPDTLRQLVDLEVGGATHALSDDELLRLVDQTIRYSVKVGHPYFANQLFSSVDPYGLIGQWLTDALNPSVYTYEVSPLLILMEEVVLAEMRNIVGFEEDGDGIFCPGGSMSNGLAINCARFKLRPDVKEKGLHSLPRLVLFTSEDAHYSIKKMASLLGLGSDNVYFIHTDDRGRLDLTHLESEIERSLSEGATPFMVSATAGTTVIGAIDPIDGIADLCERYKLWLHVDAAWGGGAMISPQHRHLLSGIKRADSVTWNPHKLLAVPQQCSALLLRHQGLLSEAHCANASYLFQKDKFYDTKYDTGDKHVQCGRRADVLKFWFMWKAKGTEGFAAHVDRVFEMSRFFLDTIRHRVGFELVYPEPEFINICFWFIPKRLRDMRDSPDYQTQLDAIAPKIKERMMKEGTMMVTYQRHKNKPNFFRIVFQNSGLEKSDILHMIKEFERLGENL